ncbi:MAG: NADH-quinone oxidoreductase subunit J [bacterium]|nr:NADH-quinone oxidoreductase subunit J [bacterium]MDI1337243.1 NADH-quinone oxidoreductase subunit J [Lacunisphaera sp.]
MTFALILLSLLILGSAAVAMALRNLIYSALLLIGSWAGIAGFYLWAGAEFVAFAQILIYVGAISMVVLFAVLLTKQGHAPEPVEFNSVSRFITGLIAGGGVAGVLLGAILGMPLEVRTAGTTPTLTVKALGAQLMGPHTAALLVIGLLLTVSLLGAVVLASDERRDQPEDAP